MDTLKNATDIAQGIPDAGVRVILLVAILFALSVLGALLWARMKEVDNEVPKGE